jgi:hypothetical protein
MLETFIEFTFEAAHQIPPYSESTGTLKVVVYLNGKPDPYSADPQPLRRGSAMAATKNLLITVTSTRSRDWKCRAWKTSPIGYGTGWIKVCSG